MGRVSKNYEVIVRKDIMNISITASKSFLRTSMIAEHFVRKVVNFPRVKLSPGQCQVLLCTAEERERQTSIIL